MRWWRTNLGQSISAMIGEGGRCSSTQQALDRIRRIHGWTIIELGSISERIDFSRYVD